VRWVFWGSAVLLAYTYVGYWALLSLRSKIGVRRVEAEPVQPPVSIVMVVRNEEAVVERKIVNLLALDYPAERKQIVVVSDGSTDRTNEILALHAADEVTVLCSSESRGKAAGLNRALAECRGEVVVFTDVRQPIENAALRRLVDNFADPAVGCVSGELMLGDPERGESKQGMGLYWRIEKRIRELESETGSVVGATGALYAVRRALLARLPEGLILDDVLIPMTVAKQGGRVLFEPRARAWDSPNLGEGREFRRKVRTLTGNYQLLQLAPWLLTRENPLRFEFISHKLLRLVAPFALLAALISSVFLTSPVYRIALLLQVVFYGLSVAGLAGIKIGPLARWSDAASTFVVLNTAAVVAFANVVAGRKAVWTR
jgi:cellulose synthase/poly-beta-1,6-N-acetylglucosamine synthase-like glycosyltransferase